MIPTADLERVLSSCAAGRADQLRAGSAGNENFDPLLCGLIDFWIGDFQAGLQRVDAALLRELPSRERALGLGLAALLSCGDRGSDGQRWGRPLAEVLASDHPRDRWWAFVQYLYAESLLAAAQVAEAAQVVREQHWIVEVWAGHPIAGLIAALPIRVAVFGGQLDQAQDLMGQAGRYFTPDTRIGAVLGALQALVEGNAGGLDATRLGVMTAAGVRYPAQDYIDRGALFLAAYGCIAAGERAAAARLALNAGCDEELSRCLLIDRALGLEIVLEAALDAGEVSDATTWLVQLEVLKEHPTTGPTCARAQARVLLVNGEVDRAQRLLKWSIEQCHEQGRQVEAAEGRIVLARAQLADQRNEAVHALVDLVRVSDGSGYGAVRRSAETVLSGSGRRLPPIVGAGWSALSTREQEIARLTLEGAELGAIAAQLHLSVRTVQVHLSRILTAFGVPTRTALLGVNQTEPATVTRPKLTPRQAEVAEAVARGQGNAQIASELAVSVKAVEKHVSDVMQRWSVRTRFGVALMWWRGVAPRER